MNTFTKPDPQAKALWRYGIIAPLLHHGDDDPGLVADVAAAGLSKTFIRPDGATIRLSAEDPAKMALSISQRRFCRSFRSTAP